MIKQCIAEIFLFFYVKFPIAFALKDVFFKFNYEIILTTYSLPDLQFIEFMM